MSPRSSSGRRKPAAAKKPNPGELCDAAAAGHAQRVEALLAAGMSANAVTAKGPARLALEAVFHTDLEPEVRLRIVKALLAHGASADTLSQTHFGPKMPLARAAYAGDFPAFELVAHAASDRTRAAVLVDALLGADPTRIGDVLATLRAGIPATSDVHDGLTPLHAAAIAGDLALVGDGGAFSLGPELPRLTATLWPRVFDVAESVRIDRGATPLGAALATRDAAMLARDQATARLVTRPGDLSLTGLVKRLDGRIARLSETIATLERAGAVDGRQPDGPTGTPFERVIAAFLPLAAALGNKRFAGQAKNIDPTGKGPINTFNACRKLLQATLDDDARRRLDQTLIGKCVTGAIDARPVVVVGERNEFAEAMERAGVTKPDTFELDLRLYPESFRTLLQPERVTVGFLGADGDTVLAVEKRETRSVVYEATPERVIEHDALVWIERGLAALVDAA